MKLSGSSDQMRELLAYLKGLDAATGLSVEERHQTALHQMACLLTGLIDEMEQLRRRQEQLENQIRQLEGADRPDDLRKRAGAIIPLKVEHGGGIQDSAPTLYCPACNRQLPIIAAMWEREAFEVACPHCSLTVEIQS